MTDLRKIADDPTYSLPVTREQAAKLNELIFDAGRYRKALRVLGYDVHPDGGEITVQDVEDMTVWLSAALRRSLEAATR